MDLGLGTSLMHFLGCFPKHAKFSIRISLENKMGLVNNCLNEVVN